MLFNSYTFVLLFLPFVVTTYNFLQNRHLQQSALFFLALASLLFYGWWNPSYLLLLLTSLVVNFFIGESLVKHPHHRLILILGIIFNLSLLAYFKYANFFVDQYNTTFNSSLHWDNVVLPLAISFFTFQQIAWLVDVYKQQCDRYKFRHYLLFVCFFPQLIAGPIVHHREMIPQFFSPRNKLKQISDINIGLTLFFLGFLKKVILADTAALYATPVFDAAARGEVISFFEAWAGSSAFSFQLYFDFSAYSDMAIGIARMFGIRLPINFYSPYKSLNIIEFWRRWHMTLSRFLRDYLYIPLGGNRLGARRSMINIGITMVLGGLWHGAAWTFVFWGAIHACLIMVNRLWQVIRHQFMPHIRSSLLSRAMSMTLTFLSVSAAWVIFRADNMDTAFLMYHAMVSIDFGPFLSSPETLFSAAIGDFSSLRYLYGWEQIIGTVCFAVICFLGPNLQQIFTYDQPAIMPINFHSKASRIHFTWKANRFWALWVGLAMAWALLAMNRVDEFLYFQF